MTSTPPVLAWAAGPAALIYENSLVALSDVLREAHLDHWQRWIDEDLRIFRARGDTSHHRQAYGGMGSFNDVAIWDRQWLGGAFEQLRGFAASAAKAAADDPSRFVQFPGVGPLHIDFSRCQACQSCFVADREIDWAAAIGWASETIPRLVGSGQGSSVIAVIRGELPPDDRPVYRKYVETRLPELGIQRHTVGQYWTSPCPTCGQINWRRASQPIF